MLKADRKKRKIRIRSKIAGNTTRPRVAVFRSNAYIWAQAIDDQKSQVVASFSQKNLKEKGTKVELAQKVGEQLAELLAKKKIKEVVFDRSGYQYHGRVKAVAEGLRTKGITL